MIWSYANYSTDPSERAQNGSVENDRETHSNAQDPFEEISTDAGKNIETHAQCLSHTLSVDKLTHE